MSGGWTPTMHLTSHRGRKPRWNEALAAFVPDDLPPGMAVAGAANGDFTLADASPPAPAAARRRPARSDSAPRRWPGPRGRSTSPPTSSACGPRRSARGKGFVDFQNDVTADDVELAEREAFRSVEHLKRYTTLGMATDQGKTSNVTALALMAEATRAARSRRRASPPSARPTRRSRSARWPATTAGKEFRPTRLPPGHAWAREHGALVRRDGACGCARNGSRSRARATGSSRPAARRARCAAASASVDVSTLGKIDVQGPDALALPRPPLCQHHVDAPGRQGALRPDAARGRLRLRRRHDRAAGAETTT